MSGWFKSVMAIGVCITVMGTASAGTVVHQSTVKFVYPLSDGQFIVSMQVDPVGCPAPGTIKYLYVSVGQNGVTADGLKNIYAAVLMAFSLQKELLVVFDDSTAACYVNRVGVYN